MNKSFSKLVPLSDEVQQLKIVIDQSAEASPILWNLLIECAEIALKSALPPFQKSQGYTRLITLSTSSQKSVEGEF